MKKMKALILALALGLTCATAATVVGCNKKGGEDNSSLTSSNWFEGETGETVTVRFASGQVSLRQYETLALECTVKGATSVTYKSSDESIVTVDENGVVTSKDVIGKATVTATADGVSATCEVSVTKSPYAPQIVLNETNYTIEEGETLQFSVATEWNQQPLDEDIEYAVTFAEDSQDAGAEIGIDGNVISVVGKVKESFNIIVSATVRGIYTSEKITVNVVGAQLKLQSASSNYLPSVSGYSVDIYATDKLGDLNSLALEFIATKGNEQFADAEIEWTANSNAIKIVDGVVIGLQRGTATVTGTTTYGGETASTEIQFNVLPSEAHLDETAVLEVEGLKTLSIKSTLLEGDAILNAELHGKVVSGNVLGKHIMLDKTNFPTQANLLGEQQLIINTKFVRYTMDVTLYTMIINDADELDKLAEISKTDNVEWSDRFAVEKNSEYFDGYFVLGNDIDYNRTFASLTDTGIVWGVQGSEAENGRGFIGVFDGMGYNIDGLTVGKAAKGDPTQSGGMFGYVGSHGVVRNVSFTNAVLTDNNGFICSRGDGLIENVSVSYKKIGGDKVGTTSLNFGNPMGTFFSKGCGPNATVRNCLIDASAAEVILTSKIEAISVSYNIKLGTTAANVENLIVLTPDSRILKTSGADVQKTSYLDLMADPAIMEKFDSSIWTTVEGIPMFVKQAETLDRDAEVGFLGVDTKLVAGFELVILTNNPYVQIEVEDVAGVAYKNGILTATEEAYKQTVTITATSLFNPDITATHEVYIDSFGTAIAAPAMDETPTVLHLTPTLVIGDNSWMGAMNYVYLGSTVIAEGATELVVDYAACEWGTNEVTIVRETDGVREHFVTDIYVWYTAGEFKDSAIIQDSAFSTARSQTEYTLIDVPSDIEAPEGYEKVTRVDCGKEWPTALSSHYFNNTSMTEYSDYWFAVKIKTARFIFQTVTVKSDDWVYFHYTQVKDGEWAVEVTVNGALYKTEFGVVGANNRFDQLFYRSGWDDGFLIYNNNGEGCTEATPTSVYVTEIRGIKK